MRCLPAVPAPPVSPRVAIIPIVPRSHKDGRRWGDHHRGRRDDDRDRQAESQTDTDPGVGREGQGQSGETEHGDQTHCPEERVHPLHGALLLWSVDRSLLCFIVSLPLRGAAHAQRGNLLPVWIRVPVGSGIRIRSRSVVSIRIGLDITPCERV